MKNIAFICMIGLLFLPMTVMAEANWWEEETPSQEPLKEVKQGDNWKGMHNWQDGYIEVWAFGAVDMDKAKNQAHAKSLALKTARNLAYEKLLENVNGIRVDSATLLEDELLKKSALKSEVSGIIKSARIISENTSIESDGSVSAEVRLGLKLKHSSELNKATYKNYRETENKPAKTEVFTAEKPENALKYTGLIIDATGLGVRPGMYPQIKSEGGHVLFTALNVDENFLLKWSAVGYASDVKQALKNIKRLGEEPLVVKAAQVEGKNKTDVIVDKEDATKIFQADLSNGFLKECRIYIITGK